MDEWWTYSPENLLMFSARTYYRLFELHHRALWPAQLAAVGSGLAIVVLMRRAAARPSRVVAALAAAAWLAVAWSYFWLRFATIHNGGRVMAAAFGAQAALLLWSGVARRRAALLPGGGAVRAVGAAIVVFAIALLPFVGRLLGRPWAQAELFGLTPDATVAATLGLLLLARRAGWHLWVIPVAWSLFSGATLWAMRSPEWWALPALALVAVAGGIARRGRAPRRPPE